MNAAIRHSHTPFQLYPAWQATGILLAATLLSFLFLFPLRIGESSSELVRPVSWIMGFALLSSFLVELFRQSPQRVLRVDNAALAAAYYYTLFEFLVPQPNFDTQIEPEAASQAVTLVLIGLIALAIGRHFISGWKQAPPAHFPSWPSNGYFWLLMTLFFLGHFPLFASISFHPGRFWEGLLLPRADQPWTRERLGGWTALLSEWKLLTFLIPPLAGLLLASRPRTLPATRVFLVVAILFLTLGISFLSGTRNITATHLATGSAAVLLGLPKLTTKVFLTSAIGLFVSLLLITLLTLQFRKGAQPEGFRSQELTLMVDNNLRTIATLSQQIPDNEEPLGWEVVGATLYRPIPRALWPGKPEGLSLSLESLVPIPETTIAASFVGEGYLAFGPVGTGLFGLSLGILFSGWNRLLTSLGHRSDVLVYTSGLCWALLSIRSPIWITVGLLPCLVLALVLLSSRLIRRFLPSVTSP